MRPLGIKWNWNIYILSDVLQCWEAMMAAVVVAEVETAVVNVVAVI